ncbi:MAG: FAD:protein FMN transferase [Clostridia bacterium]|nr:FAD:protein FMN transferase [Clostridia bacterium]
MKTFSKGKTVLIFLLLFAVIITLDVIFFDDNYYEGMFFKMDTDIVIRGEGNNMDLATRDILKMIDNLDANMNASNVNGNLYKLNNEGGTVSFDSDTIKVLEVAEDIKIKSNGAFNVAIRPLVELWGFNGNYRKVPTDTDIADTLSVIASTQIKREGNKVSITPKGKIDLSGIAKGYASDKASEILKEYDVDFAILDFGGNIMTYGQKPDGSPFKISIDDGKEGVFATLSIKSGAVITSGEYQRYFEENGKKYHHILDPKTGFPAENGLVSVTILSDSGVLADALSTACFVLGAEDGINLAKDCQVKAVLLDKNKNVYTVGNPEITLAEGYKLTEK